jgi:hypothetical protein
MRNKRLLATALVLVLCLSLTSPALADNGVNPLTAIDNLTNMLYLIATGIGVVFLLLGGIQLGLALKEQDPGQRSRAIMQLVGGLLIVGLRFVVQMILSGTGM